MTNEQDTLDARRYRAFRDAMIAEDEKFLAAMEEALPEGAVDRAPTAELFDLAVDAGIKAMENKDGQ